MDGAFVTADGVDCFIPQAFSFQDKWFSHEFDAPGLHYETGLSIGGRNVVWVNKPFLPRSYSKSPSFKSRLTGFLLQDEPVTIDC